MGPPRESPQTSTVEFRTSTFDVGNSTFVLCDAPGRIRTSDQQLRRLLLYPPELRARTRRADDNLTPAFPLLYPLRQERPAVPQNRPSPFSQRVVLCSHS